jgi:putative salt-induced outer membrane protein YdiY
MLRQIVLVGLMLSSARALAGDPKWTYGTHEEVKAVVWKAAVQAGLVLNTGNANNLAFTSALSGSRYDGHNRLQLDLGGTYARSTVISATDSNMSKFIDPGEISRKSSTSSALWGVKLRYDRFLSANNSLYVAGFATGNEPAGIRVATGAQAGYSRQVIKTDRQLLVTEIGYDFTYQNNTSGVNLNIHSARLFAGYTLTLSKDVGVALGLEALFNLNPLPGYTADTTIDPFGNTRLNGNAALTARLWKNISFQVSFLAKYTTDPAPLPAFAIPYVSGYVPLAERLDTVTSLSLVVTLL